MLTRIRFLIYTLAALGIAALLSSCGPMGFTPESAALNAVQRSSNPQFTLNAASLTVRQTLKIDESNAMVEISFSGVQQGIGVQDCLYVYHVIKGTFGWSGFSGGGGCSSGTGEPQPVDFGVGRYGGMDPKDPGYSEVHGEVNQAEIVKLRVTWADDQVAEAEVINASFLTVRVGQVDMKRVQGFNAQGDLLYDYQPQFGPGKE